MKKLVFAMLLLLPLTALAQPQTPPKPEEMAKKQTERLKKEVTLTADQEKKVNEVYLASATKMEAAFKSGQSSRETMVAKLKEIRAEEETQLKTILTADQFTQFQAAQKKWDAERAQRHGGPGQAAPRQ